MLEEAGKAARFHPCPTSGYMGRLEDASESLASLTSHIQAPSSPGMCMVLSAVPGAFRNWLGLQVDLYSCQLVATWPGLALLHRRDWGR